MKQKTIIANWKMNKTMAEATTYIDSLLKSISQNPVKCQIIIAAQNLLLPIINEKFPKTNISTSGQNCSEYSEGAYTGETSAKCLLSIGTKYCLIGHSERRAYYNERNEILAKKIKTALETGLIPIYCCGETLKERETNLKESVVQNQLNIGLGLLTIDELKKVIIAYEPVWAISTMSANAKTATKEQAQEMHALIRKYLNSTYNIDIPILYGGSVKPENAKELFEQPDIDGGLVGGASLDPESFYKICQQG